MIKSDKFIISTKHYAFKPGSLHVGEVSQRNDGSAYCYYSMQVFYYKKKDNRLTACFGRVWAYDNAGLTEVEFVERYRASYGPDMVASWNGENFFGVSNYRRIVEYVTELKPILDDYPAIPEGYIGWYKNA